MLSQLTDAIDVWMSAYRESVAGAGPMATAEARARGDLRERLSPTPSVEVGRFNKARVLRIERTDGQEPGFKVPILLVPSLINRAYILDLVKGFSLAERLRDEGFQVYLLDWGVPEDEDRDISFDDLLDPLLARAVRAAARDSGAERVSLVGYCMGATLCAIHAALDGSRVHSLVNLLGPIDFSRAGILGQWTEAERFDPGLLSGAFGNVPASLMQSAFQGLRPTAQLAKAVRGTKRDERLADFFAALEYWAWDNIPFPGNAYERYIRDLYQKNLLVHGRLSIRGRKVDLKRITCPVLVLTADRDHIVPVEAASVLCAASGSKDTELITVRGGHVAAVVGPSASRELWPRLVSWLGPRSIPTQFAR